LNGAVAETFPLERFLNDNHSHPRVTVAETGFSEIWWCIDKRKNFPYGKENPYFAWLCQ
jgi:hypothetical protein